MEFEGFEGNGEGRCNPDLWVRLQTRLSSSSNEPRIHPAPVRVNSQSVRRSGVGSDRTDSAEATASPLPRASAPLEGGGKSVAPEGPRATGEGQ